MRILFFDTESTGLLDRRAGPESPTQPHLVQLGAILTDGKGREIDVPLSAIVKPNGWKIPADAVRVHGISTKTASARGVKLHQVIDRFDLLAKRAQLLVAHNLAFDLAIMTAAYARAGLAHPFDGKDTYCTMKAATDICKLPGRYGYKWPTLTEAVYHFFKEHFVDAHDALKDVRACSRVYFSLPRRA